MNGRTALALQGIDQYWPACLAGSAPSRALERSALRASITSTERTATASVHYGAAGEICERRTATLDAAYAANPARFRHRPPTPPKLSTVAWISKPSPEALINPHEKPFHGP